MTPPLFNLRLLPILVSAFCALQSNASPTATKNPGSLSMVNPIPNAIIFPHCYHPDGADTPGIQPTNLQACKDALQVLIRFPDFTTRFRFSRNPRTMAKEVPAGWQLGTDAECRIIVNCLNDRDTAIFRYADVARLARKIMDECVDSPDPHQRVPLLKWGGVKGIEGTETFYVAVARPITFATDVHSLNGTLFLDRGMDGGDVDIL